MDVLGSWVGMGERLKWGGWAARVMFNDNGG